MAEAVDHGYCSSTCPGCPTPEIGEPWPRLASLSAPTTSRTRGRFPVSFRKPSPWPSPSRRPSPRDARALMSPSAGRDKPLQGAKAGRVTVLPQGVVFTALRAGRPGGRAVAYAPQAEMSCLCGYAELRSVMGTRMSARRHEHPEPGDGHCGFYDWKLGPALPVDGGDVAAGG
jgi:hypothetical protein